MLPCFWMLNIWLRFYRLRFKLNKTKNEKFSLLSKVFVSRSGLHPFWRTITMSGFDIIFYSQNLFQKNILNAAGWVPLGKTMNTLEEVSKIARTQTFCILCSTVTSYWLSLPV